MIYKNPLLSYSTNVNNIKRHKNTYSSAKKIKKKNHLQTSVPASMKNEKIWQYLTTKLIPESS